MQVEHAMTKHIAVLVDGDNISAAHASAISRITQENGSAQIMRVYTDATRLSAWHEAAGFRLIHSGSGKNATDLLMSIDAVELALSGKLDSFVIASSDADFTHLAQRLREYGLDVIGIGDQKAPQALRAACTRFHQLGVTCAIPAKPSGKQPAKHSGASDLDCKIRDMIAKHSQKARGIRLNLLAPSMHAEHKIRISTQPERNWRGYLAARPHLFELDPRGPEAMVRFKPDGFAA